LIHVNNLSIHFGDFIALEDITLTFKKTNGVIGLIGPNGAGKTTLISAIIGQLKFHKGFVNVNHEDVAYCPDVPSFESFLTPKEVLEQTIRLRGKPVKNYKKKILDVLKDVDLTKSQNKLVGGFSRGMRQRLGIASALVLDPKIIFLDEPTSALDPFGQKDVLQLVDKVAKNHVVVISSHNLKDVEKIAKEIIVLNEGRLIYKGNLNSFAEEKQKLAIIEFSDSKISENFDVILQENNISHSLVDKSIKFENYEIKKVLSLVNSYADYIVRIEREIFSLEDAFEAHVKKSQ
ncbi:ABC transporter ATP-binding protein, partial [Staphylococcus pseudintermedius]|nr:ABC transporter ATP-binding protein [Staphylococcus pseudintermedius]